MTLSPKSLYRLSKMKYLHENTSKNGDVFLLNQYINKLSQLVAEGGVISKLAGGYVCAPDPLHQLPPLR